MHKTRVCGGLCHFFNRGTAIAELCVSMEIIPVGESDYLSEIHDYLAGEPSGLSSAIESRILVSASTFLRR